MKIIQSYWSLPANSPQTIQGRALGGWPTKEHHYMSMALSCLLLRRFYSDVELITDIDGKALLIDQLKLPYTSVKVVLDNLNTFNPSLWALPKLYTYSIQKEPFIHVDGDVFIWAPFDTTLLQSSLIAQSVETHQFSQIYDESLLHVRQHLSSLPSAIATPLDDFQIPASINAGILGGNNINFINHYANTALDIINNNKDFLDNDLKAGKINVVIEQYLFYQLAILNNEIIDYAILKLNKSYDEILSFNQVPYLTKYIHVLSNTKQKIYCCEQVEYRLQYEFPNEFKALANSLGIKKNSLLIPWDNSSFIDDNSPLIPISAKYEKTQHLISSYHKHFVSIDHNEIKLFLSELKNSVSNKDFQFLNKIFLAEKKAQIVSRRSLRSSKDIKKAFDFVKNADLADIVSCEVTLATNSTIINGVWPPNYNSGFIDSDEEDCFFILQNKRECVIAQNLLSWNKLLIYFHNRPFSGKLLLEEILSDAFDLTNDKDGLEKTVYDFITTHVVCTGYLTMV